AAPTLSAAVPPAVAAAVRLRPTRLPPRRSRHDGARRALADRALRSAWDPERQPRRQRGLKESIMSKEHVDVLIVGAGLSGVGAGHYIQAECPWASYAIFEARDAIGGTWDLFRYPGVRSDSDMFTLGYRFRPWASDQAIADGGSILRYIKDVAAEEGVDRHIRFNHRIVRADWSTADAVWHVTAERSDTGDTVELTAGF